MKTLSSRLSLKSDNAVCKSESFNDKHQAIEEPDEPKGSCPVLNERVRKRFLTRLKPKIRYETYWAGGSKPAPQRSKGG